MRPYWGSGAYVGCAGRQVAPPSFSVLNLQLRFLTLPPCFSSIQLQDSYKGHSLLLQTYVVKMEEFPLSRQKLSNPLALIPVPLALTFFLLLLLQGSLILEEVI